MEQSSVKRIWSGFWQLADPKIWVASTVPMAVAAALAYARTGSLALGWFILAVIGIYLMEIGKNAVNEFVDYKAGIDQNIAADKRNPFSGGKKTIVDGKLSMKETAVIAVATLTAAFLIGISIAWIREPNVLWIGMIGGILAVCYSLPPFKLNYRGLGEIAVALGFGPLLLLGMYVMLTGSLDWYAAFIGLPTAFLIANVLWINQYPDYEADLMGGKRNWLVRVGKEKGIKVYAALFIGAYLCIALIAIVDFHPIWLIGLATIPLAVRAVRIAANNLNNFQEFLKANAGTVQLYMLVGLAILVGALVAG